MESVQEYWRDKVVLILQWGGAVFILFAGWAIENSEKFRLVNVSWPHDKSQIFRGGGLLCATFIYAILLPYSVFRIYQKHLPKEKIDKTVLSKNLATAIGGSLSFLTLIIAILMCFI